MATQTRKTEIIAHKSKSNLQKIFPDPLVERTMSIYKANGELFCDPIPYSPGLSKDEVIKDLAEAAGYEVEIAEVETVYDNFIRLPGLAKDFSVREKSDRKTGIIFESQMEEHEHYAVVDEIVKELAENDVAVLRGDCEITITTRC